MKNKKVVLINPRATYVNEIAQKCYPPLNLLYLASSLKSRGFESVVLDANAFKMSDEYLIDIINKIKPLLTGIPLYSDILQQVYTLTKKIKRKIPGSGIVTGGPHASAVPEETLAQFSAIDYVLAGEAEDSLPELCHRLINNDPLKETGGIYFRENGEVIRGTHDKRPDIHKISYPSRELVADAYKEKRYYTLMVRRKPVDTMITSRGCPFHCGFCYNMNYQYRARKPEDVVHELTLIRERGIRDVEICDDNFTANKERALRILDLIIKEKLDISFRIKSRADIFTEELAAKARQAGVYLVAFGLESGSQRMLDIMEKKITIEESARACYLTRKYKMLSHSSWIIGYPGETVESINDTLTFIKKNRPGTVNMAVIRPYPKTVAYEIAKQEGTLTGQWRPDMDDTPWIKLPWVSEISDLYRICERIKREIYFTPYYMASFAGHIIKEANPTLARYALQEAGKSLVGPFFRLTKKT